MPVAVERRERTERLQLGVGEREMFEREIGREEHQVHQLQRACDDGVVRWCGGGGVVVVWWWWCGGGGVVVVVVMRCVATRQDSARASHTTGSPYPIHTPKATAAPFVKMGAAASDGNAPKKAAAPIECASTCSFRMPRSCNAVKKARRSSASAPWAQARRAAW